jgi:hypothetical protein
LAVVNGVGVRALRDTGVHRNALVARAVLAGAKKRGGVTRHRAADVQLHDLNGAAFVAARAP